MRAAEPFALAQLTLRNRLVGTAHGRGIVEDGLPLPEDAEYWRRRAAGGAAMLTVGGTVVAPESTWRRRITTEAWRPEAVPGMAARAEAIRAEGAVAACQLVHLGRETTGAEQWFHPVGPVGGALAARAHAAAPADRRRARRDRRGLPHLGGQRRRGGVRGHRAARRARLPARPVPVGGDEPPAGASRSTGRLAIVAAHRRARSARRLREVVVGIRLSIDGGEEAGLTVEGSASCSRT